jgi:WD40 repeat protein
VQRIAWSADGALLVGSTTTLDGFDPSSGVVRRLLTLTSPERLLAIAPDGKLVATQTEQSIRVLDPLNGVEVRKFPTAGFVGGALFRGGSGSLALLTADRVVTLWDVTTGRQQGELSAFQSAAPVYSIEFSPDGKRAAWIARGTAQFADVATNALGVRLQFEDFVGHAVFSPDGTRLATITAGHEANALSGLMQIWDSTSGKELARVSQTALFAFVAYSPDGALVATGSNDGLALWSAADGAPAKKIDAARAGNVRLLSFSQDGSTLASVSDDGAARIWRILAQ